MKRRKHRRTGNPPGRPSKLTPQTMDKIVSAIAEGSPLYVACGVAGISRSTLRLWRQNGRKNPDSEEGRILHAIRDAKNQAHFAVASVFYRAAKKDPYFAERWLARMYPNRWAKQPKQQLEAEVRHTGELRYIALPKKGRPV